MNKSVLRKRMIAYLKQLSPTKKASIETRLATQLFQTNFWKDASVIGLTVSQNFEWDTYPIMKKAWKEGKTVVVPKCNPTKKRLMFYKIIDYEDLQVGYANILEPHAKKSKQVKKRHIELLIVPGLVFDQYGFRIGFGGGYYDRFLMNFTGITASLASEAQMAKKLPVDAYDMPVTYIITENSCTKRLI